MRLAAVLVASVALAAPAVATADTRPPAPPAPYYQDDGLAWFVQNRCTWNNDDPTCPHTRAAALAALTPEQILRLYYR